MDVIESILKIYPDWRGMVWENDYKRIVPHVHEKRPIPTVKELEAAWKNVLADREAAAADAHADTMIQTKIRELAVKALVTEGKLTADGKITKETKT